MLVRRLYAPRIVSVVCAPHRHLRRVCITRSSRAAECELRTAKRQDAYACAQSGEVRVRIWHTLDAAAPLCMRVPSRTCLQLVALDGLFACTGLTDRQSARSDGTSHRRLDVRWLPQVSE